MILICCVFVANINRELEDKYRTDTEPNYVTRMFYLGESRMASFKMTKTFGLTIIQFCCMGRLNLKLSTFSSENQHHCAAHASHLNLFDWNMRISRYSRVRIISFRQLLINLLYSFQIWQDYRSVVDVTVQVSSSNFHHPSQVVCLVDVRKRGPFLQQRK